MSRQQNADEDADRSPLPSEEWSSKSGPILSIRDLKQYYPVTEGILNRRVGDVKAVDGVSLDVYPGETLAVVGESGCGKSTLAETIMGAHTPTSGDIFYKGCAVSEFTTQEHDRFRREIGFIFQNPRSSLNDRMTIGSIVREPLKVHGIAGEEQRERVFEMLEHVGLDPDVYYNRFPHELSGGQCQRVSIARGLILEPTLLIADEPVSALDVSVQSQILTLLSELEAEFNLTTIIITHDLSVVKHVADRIGVMYLGRFVETGRAETVFDDPKHPYTQALLSSVPRVDPNETLDRIRLQGTPPDPSDPPTGCNFNPRCPLKRELSQEEQRRCETEDPSGDVACHFRPEE